ncbi:hypothetical protein VB264_17450 [Arcicella aquatica]|uniref:Uncharacterized protein n=1 Tax=Arcicella aquatica TaxID=217141 RepID=A0ABU5QR96_9BACT|nr:hypothetical protein [Arcicella aquatica]MEA5259588.1 hypothetical protein [Arcicella aquatica]
MTKTKQMSQIKFNYTQPLRWLCVGLIFFCVIFFCKASQEEDIKNVIISAEIPFVLENGNIQIISKKYKVYHWRNFILYLLPFENIVEKDTSIISWKTDYSYFIYQKNNKRGVFFESLEKVTKDSVDVDSVLQELNAWKNMNCILISKMRLTNSVFNSKKITQEIYLSKDDSVSSPDTAIVEFSEKLNNIQYSLCEELEKKGTRVSRIKFLFNSKSSKDFPFKIPKREYVFTIISDEENQSKEISTFMKTFCLK